MESGDAANQVVDQQRETDDRDAVGDEDQLDVGIGADIAVNVAWEGDVLLPENDPVTGKNQQKQHEFGVGQNSEEIAQRFGNAGRGAVAGALGLAEEEENREEHGEDAEGSNAKYVFDAEMTMSPRRDVGARSAPDVHHGVVNGVADGAHVFL